MKKILFCASTVSHINNFHLPYLKAFHDMGYEVHVAVDKSVPIQFADQVFALPFKKNLFSPKNIIALFRARKLIKSQGYTKISSNTTLAGVIVRIAALFLKDRPRIYHIVHGYHFNKKFSLKKLLYLLPEKLAALTSDVVMVMNHEDLEMAKKYKLFKDKLYYINGIGISPSRFMVVSDEEKTEIKKRMGFSKDDFLFVYVAEFSKRKNHKMLIKAFAKCNIKEAHLLLAGEGSMVNRCKRLARKINLSNRIHFLGYVNDIPNLYSACDVAVTTSLIEGLPFNVIEAMGCGLPVIASNIKGHRELVIEGQSGKLFDSEQELTSYMREMYELSPEIRNEYRSRSDSNVKEFINIAVFDKIMHYYSN